MKKESRITEEDYRDFFRELHLWYQPAIKIVILVLIVMLFALNIHNNKNYTWIGALSTLLIVAFFMFGMLFAVPYTIEIMRFELYKSHNNFIGYTISITNESIVVISNNEQVVYKFSNIKRSRLTRNFLSLRLHHNTPKMRSGLFLVHKSDFDSDNEMSRFFYYNHKFTYAVNRPANYQKIPYAWGILGIIPFIGGINGLIMVINGIFKFKSTAYVIIGALGIFFTIYIFHAMTPSFNNKAFAGGMRSSTQQQLNNVVKSIEFYKLKYNQYPDNLEQLSVKDSSVSIFDPIYTFEVRKGTRLFNYQKLGNKYTLFSSGIDTIPHTADDIYPTITISDTSKFGLIKK